MKRFESGDALAKEMGLDPTVLAKTFEDYNTSVRTKKDPFGKKVRLYAGLLLLDIRGLTKPRSSSPPANGG
jgi:hypothetical protein